MPLFDYPTAPVSLEDVHAFAMGAEIIFRSYYPDGRLEVVEPQHPHQSMIKIIGTTDQRQGVPWVFVDLTTGLIYATNGQGTPARFARGTITTAAFGAEYLTPFGPRAVRSLVA